MKPTCRLPACTTAADTAGLCSKHYRARLGRGEHGYVDAAPVVRRLRLLDALGWSSSEVERRTGQSHTNLARIKRGDFRRVKARTANLILAIEPELLDSRLSVDATGTRRRVEALARMGWTARVVSESVDLRPSTLSKMFWRGTVSRAIANRVARFYGQNSGTFGGDRRIAAKSATLGYAPPIAWEDVDIDDPMARPNVTGYDEGRVRAYLSGEQPVGLTKADKTEAVARLVDEGLTPLDAARAVGVRALDVQRWLGADAA